MRSVRTPWISCTVGSARSFAPVALQKRSPMRKSRLPCMRYTGTPRRETSASRPAITALNGASRSSSPTQDSKKSPRMYSASAAGALASSNSMNRSFASGRSSVRWRSEMKSEGTTSRLLLGADHRHGLDHHGLLRHVAAEGAARAGRRLGDLGHHVHAVDYLAEDRIAPAVLAGIVEEVVALDVDEELRACRVRIAGARHSDGSDVVLQAVLRLVLDRLRRRFLVVGLVEAAALDHEAVDHPVEHRAVVVPVLYVLQEILDRLRRLGRVELQADRADVGLDVHLRIGCERAAGDRGEGQDEKMLQLHAVPLEGVQRGVAVY